MSKDAAKGKMSKAQKLQLAAELAEKMRLEAERERQNQIQDEKNKIEKEKLLAAEKAVNDLEEHELRMVQLKKTNHVFARYTSQMDELEERELENERWQQYMKCDGLPDPANIPEMNTYLYLWKQEDDDIIKVFEKTETILDLLRVLESLIERSLEPDKVEDWKEVRNDFRLEQQKHLDNAVYKLISNMEENMELNDLNVARFKQESKYMLLCLWALLPLPQGLEPPEDTPRPIKTCEFEDLGLSLVLPGSLAFVDFVVRAMHVNYDHYSDLCPSWELKNVPIEYDTDLETAMLNEWGRKQGLQTTVDELLASRTKLRYNILSQMAAPQPPPTPKSPQQSSTKGSAKHIESQLETNQDFAKTLQELPPIQTASEMFCSEEEEHENQIKSRINFDGEAHELNLRKYVILAGVLHVDLIKQLSQPHKLPNNWTIMTVHLPKQIEPVNFWAKYTPPPPPEPGQKRLPEDIEAELKQQEQELNELALINIVLPSKILWFEPPTVARWDSEKEYWSTEDCHDIKFNEDKQTITFRLGRFGPIGLAAYKYCNLPYQTWELRPDMKNGGVSLIITAAVVIVEFNIKDDGVCLMQVANGPSLELQELYGIYHKPQALIKIMCQRGVDIFPLLDAFCYVEGSCPKHRVAESHLYHCMALASTAYNFAWSRWNLLAGRRNIVLQIREYLDKKRLPNHSMLYVTPLKAYIVDCTEVSQSFSDIGVTGMKFYADLHQLLDDQATYQAKSNMNSITFRLTEFCV